MSEMGLMSEGAGPSTSGVSLSAKVGKAYSNEVSDAHAAGSEIAKPSTRRTKTNGRKTVFYS